MLSAPVHRGDNMRNIAAAFAAVVVTFIACEPASAASQQEALAWLAGNWTNKGDCGIGSVQFTRNGSRWVYRELRYNHGAPYPATASANSAGVVTVLIEDPDGNYEYVNTFRDQNSFDAVEGFTQGPLKDKRKKFTYTRCR